MNYSRTLTTTSNRKSLSLMNVTQSTVRFCLLALAGLLIAGAAQAVPIVALPTGLNAGDQYRLIFVTNNTQNLLQGSGSPALTGNLSNTAFYNSFVTSQANQSAALAALNASWKALYSTSFLDARDNAGINYTIDANGVPIYLVDGSLVASTNTQFWTQDNNVPINVTQSGTQIGTERIWTATKVTGIWLPTAFGGRRDAFGLSNQINSKHFIGSNVVPTNRNELHRFYGISEVLTVAAVPAPGTLALAMIGLLGLLAQRKQRAV